MDKGFDYKNIGTIIGAVVLCVGIVGFLMDFKWSGQRDTERTIATCEDGSKEVIRKLEEWIARDDQLNTDWKKEDETDHAGFDRGLQSIAVSMNQVKESTKYMEQHRFEEIETLLGTVLAEIADVRVAVAECK